MDRREFIKTSGVFLAVVSTSSSLFANAKEIDFRVVENPTLLMEGNAKLFCPVCGMHLGQYYKTSTAADVDGKTHQYCSFHCMVEEAMTNKADPVKPQVVDVTSLNFVDGAAAYYVYGSSKPATMSAVGSYGFASEAEAKKFAGEFGGDVLTYDVLLAKSKETMADDLKLIEKRQTMAAKKGEEIFKARCGSSKIDAKFKTSGEAKAYLLDNKPCGELSPMELSQVSHYLKFQSKI